MYLLCCKPKSSPDLSNDSDSKTVDDEGKLYYCYSQNIQTLCLNFKILISS